MDSISAPKYGGRKGTKTQWFEFIGYRPCVTSWCELLCVGDDFMFFRDTLTAERLPDGWHGFERFQVLKPGDKRPVDVIATAVTNYAFIGRDCVHEFIDQWFEEMEAAAS